MNNGPRTQLDTTTDRIVLKISGAIDEFVQFPKIDPNLPLQIDFGEVTRINSRGIKLWCHWIGQFKAPTKIHLERCPTIVIKSFNLVKGCIPAVVQVDSFFVPLYSEQSGERRDFLVTRGHEFDQKSVKVPDQKDSKGNPMEVDVHDSYWEFLSR
jgi:ABC-type transporter Mla MlaB component